MLKRPSPAIFTVGFVWTASFSRLPELSEIKGTVKSASVHVASFSPGHAGESKMVLE